MQDEALDTANSIKEALRYLLVDAERINADLVSLHIRLAIAEAYSFATAAGTPKSASSK